MSFVQTPVGASPESESRSPRSPERPFYITGGTLPPDASSYVPRHADRDLFDGLLMGDYCYVLNTRQMGKSSLMIRAAQQLREAGCAVAALDLTAIGQNLSVEQWYDGLLISLAEQIGLDDEMEDFWADNPHLGPMQRFLGAIRHVALPAMNGRSLIIFVDEIDAVRSLPFSVNEFFGGIRECYNRRAQDPAFERLTFCLLGVATPADLINDTRISPFNVGRRIALSDFTPAEAAPLAQGMGPKGEVLLSRVLYWTNGHPYMTQRLCRSVAEAALSGSVSAADVDRLCESLFLSKAARDSDDNLAFVRTRLLRSDADLASLLDLYQKVRTGKRVPDDETNPLCSVLRLSGVARVDERGTLQVRNRIYDRVFDKDWVIAHMPDAEVRRQRAAYWRGMAWSAGIGTLITSSMAGLAVYAFIQQSQAQTERQRAENNLQVANQQKTRAENEKARAETQKAEAEKQTGIADKARKDAENQRAEAIKQKAAADKLNQQLNASLAQVRAERQRADESAQDARRAQQTALSAKNDSDYQRDVAFRQKRVAEEQKRSARQNLINLAVYKGLRLAEDGDYGSATPYVAKAWRLEAGDPQRDRAHATRFADLMLRAPRLVNQWSVSGRVMPAQYAVGFTANGAVALETGGRFAGTPSALWKAGEEMAKGGATLALWRPEEGLRQDLRPLTFTKETPNHFIYLSPDGRIAVSQTPAKRGGFVRLRVWSVADAGRRPAVPLSEAWETSPPRFADAFAVARDGSRIVVMDVQGKARVGDMATGKTLLECKADGPVALSPDGKYVAYVGQRPGSTDSGAQIVRVDDGKALERAIRDKITGLNFSPDGTRLAVTTPYNTRFYKMNEVRDGDGPRLLPEPLTVSTSYALSAVFTPDSRTIAIGNGDGAIDIFDVGTGNKKTTLKVAEGGVGLLAYSPDGAMLAACGLSQTVRLWRAGSPYRAIGPLAHAAQVWRCVFSPNSRLLLTDDYGSSVRLWDTYQAAPGGRPLVSVEGTEFISDLAFSADGKSVAAQRSGGEIVVADARTGADRFPPLPTRKTGYTGRPEYRVRFSPDSRLLAFNTDAAALVYDARTGKRLLEAGLSSSEKGVISRRILFTPDSRQVVTADTAGSIQFRDIASGKVTAKVPFPTDRADPKALTDIALSPDGTRVAVATRWETYLWNRVTGVRTRMEGPDGSLPGDRLIFRPDGKALLCYGYSIQPKGQQMAKGEGAERFQSVVWDTGTGRVLRRLNHPDNVNAAAFSPDGRRIITASGNKAYLWNAATGQPNSLPMLHQNAITDALFTADSALAVTTGLDGVVRVWDAATGSPVLERNGQDGNKLIVSAMVCLAVPPGGREIAGGGWVGAAAWELPPSPGTPEQTIRMSHLLACEDFDATKGNLPLSQARLDAEWKKLDDNALMGGLIPSDVETLRRIANYEYNKGRWEASEQAASELLRKSPADLDGLESRAAARVAQGAYRGALADMERSAALRPDPTSLGTERAMLLLVCGEGEKYRALCRRLSSAHLSGPLEGQDVAVLRYLIYGPGGSDDYDQTLQLFQRAFERKPDYQDAPYMRMGVLYRAGRYDDALTQWERMDKKHSGSWLVRETGASYFAAMSYARLNRPDKARELLTQARQRRNEIAPQLWRWRLEADLLEKEASGMIQ